MDFKAEIISSLLLVSFCLLSNGAQNVKSENSSKIKSSTTLPPDQFSVESQLPVDKVEEKRTTTPRSMSSDSPKRWVSKTKANKPSCFVIFKTVEAPPGYLSPNGKIKMACTTCSNGGYRENCIYVDQRVMTDATPEAGTVDGSVTLESQESRPSETYGESSESKPSSDHYVPVYETTASSVSDVSADSSGDAGREDGMVGREGEMNQSSEEIGRMESKNEEREGVNEPEDTREEEEDSVNESKDDVGFGGPIHIIPEEYMQSEYDPKFYESHDEAANVFHVTPYVFEKSPYEREDDSNEGKESRRSSTSVLPGFDILKSVLPDVEPLNPDKDVKPRKRQKTVEYTEQVSFSSDDIKGKKSSKMAPSTDYDGEHSVHDDNFYRPHVYAGSTRQTRGGRGSERGERDEDYYDQYKPPIDMPAFDSKDCLVSYKDSPQGGPRMKCTKCKGKNNAFSEECGVEYDMPTKHREVTYDARNYDADPKEVLRKMYGSEQAAYAHIPKMYDAPYYPGNPYSPRKGSSSKYHANYLPFKGYYNPFYSH